MGPDFSYRHLYYFWVVAKEGGVARAAERLGMAVARGGTHRCRVCSDAAG